MRTLYSMLFVLLLPILAGAQEADPFPNPPDPLTKYKVSVVAAPRGYTSGSGKYIFGSSVWISTSSYSRDYIFSHWNKNGVLYSTEPSFSYTVEAASTVFEAVYDYNPADPSDPQSNKDYRLHLTNNIPQACSFNRSSGAKAAADEYVYVQAYPSSDYEFQGWYEGSTLVSSTLSFYYLMPYASATLTARFRYNPRNPGEPVGSSSGVDKGLLGDVNGDETVDAIDAAIVILHYLNGTTGQLNPAIADADRDGVIDAIDAALIIQMYLEK